MSSKKKSTIKKAPVESIEQIDPTPTEDVPIIQLDEVPVEEKIEPVQEAEPEKSAEVKPQPVVEYKIESTHTLPPKPKTLTLAYIQEEFETLMEIIELHSTLITELQETQARKRKAPLSNGKIMIKDTKTGKIYPSKNNVYQSLLKAGELKELVDKGIFGDIPEKNSFGCYQLFRAFPGRFEEVKPEETNVA